MEDTLLSAEKTSGEKCKRLGLYKALRYIPAILFAVYVGLIFIFSLLPVAFYHSANSGIPDSLIGNAYHELSGELSTDNHIWNSLIAMYVFCALSAVYSVAMIFICRTARFKKRRPGAFIGDSFAGNIYSIMYAFYIIFFVLGCTVMTNVLVDDAGRGVLSLGPFSPVVMAVDLFFSACSIATVVVRYRMENKNGALRRIESEADARKA